MNASSEKIRVRVGVVLLVHHADCVGILLPTLILLTLSHRDELFELSAWPSCIGFGLDRFVEKSAPHLKLGHTFLVRDPSTFSDMFDSNS
jgi:hypothetical protein